MKKGSILFFLVMGIMLFTFYPRTLLAQGSCLEFSYSDNDRVEIPNESEFDFTTEMTVECWVKVNSFDVSWQAIVTKGDDSWRLQRDNGTNFLCFHLTNVYQLNGTTSVNDGEWHHVAGTFSSSNSLQCLYIDGNLDASNSSTGTIANSDYPVWIGANAQRTGRSFNGKIDEVRVWNYAKSQSEIQNDMHNYNITSSHPHWSNLIGYWKFDENSGQTTEDSSSNSHTGTLGTTTSAETEDPAWTTSDAPLPVTLGYFTAQYMTDFLKINWATYSENSNSYWNIYRSSSEDFEQAFVLNSETIEGNGTTSELSQYTYQDNYQIEKGKTYYYWLESVDYAGNSYFYGAIHVTTPENIDNPDAPPTDLKLTTDIQKIFPNPFNPSTAISYYLDTASNVKIEIYNLKGQKVFAFDEGFKSAGQTYSVVWNGENFQSQTLPSGIYLFKLIANDVVKTKKALLEK